MDDAERLARLAERAAAEIEDGMVLGLGSGTTTEAVIRALGRRVAAGLRVTGVPTSGRTERLARELGIPLRTLDEVERIDLGIDGADEIDPALNVTKGRGGALLYEKLVALACDRYLIVAASEKLVEQLGTRMPLPVEVIPLGWKHTAARLAAIGCPGTLRCKPDGAVFTSDGGHVILDCQPGPLSDPAAIATAIKATTGVVEHGLFVGLVDQALVADRDGTIRLLERTSARSPR
ncbi:MAG TPA: ribose-5-phosphate isomerase RpiA [Thermomicrobiales bacterium]|mgnify:CR=1 FL=1